MLIDCHGYRLTDRGFMKWRPRPYRIKTEGGATYVCFTNDALRCIHRYTTSAGETVAEWAYGPWDDAANLVYIPINQPREVRHGRVL